MQNIAKEPGIREQYVAPPGYVICSCDYNQQELVALAQICYTRYGFSRLRDLINHGIDVHNYTGCRIGGVFAQLPDFSADDEDILEAYRQAILAFKKENPTKFQELRKLAKAANFGYPGGLGAARFRTYARGYGVVITEQASQELRKMWMETLPEMALHLKPEPMTDGRFGDCYKAVTLTGRMRVNCSFCAACNSVFQGLAADCSKVAGWRLLKEGFYLGDFVHDEYLAMIPMDEHLTARADYMAQVMVEEMQKLTPDVKVKAGPALMFRWTKSAEEWRDGEGDLIPWEMVPHTTDAEGHSFAQEWNDLTDEQKQTLLKNKRLEWSRWREPAQAS